MSILFDLWNGNLSPIKEGRDSEELRQLIYLINSNYEKLQAMLNQEQQKRIETYAACVNEYCSLFAEQAFCSGFRLGSGLFAESWIDNR